MRLVLSGEGLRPSPFFLEGGQFMEHYQVTGNEYLSLPTVRESDGAIEGLTCLYMRLKGMLELKGKDGFVCSFLELNGVRQALKPVWSRECYWIPTMSTEADGFSFSCTYLTPTGERGFALRLTAVNRSQETLVFRIGADGAWTETWHTVNESILLESGKSVKDSGWNQMFVFQQIPGIPLIAFAPVTGDSQPFSRIDQGVEWKRNGFEYSLYKTTELRCGECVTLDLFFGIGYEEVSACTAAKEMLRQGFDTLLIRTESWLRQRAKPSNDPVIRTLLNTNLFFAFFFASGRTVDTEELVMMTSRSPRYYVSAAYWDRDSLLWAFPAIVEADPEYARELILSVFHRQGRNFGIHSRYIDGTVLEPGFELDELCAPVIALERYVNRTGDAGLLFRPEIRDRLEEIERKLESRRHSMETLYSTFLQPTDDMHRYPYLTYDNALVWKTLHSLSEWLGKPELAVRAEDVRKSILKCCIQEEAGRQVYVWSTDLNGHWDIYDEPPGSLQILPFYGFCDPKDPIWRNTVDLIRNERYPLSFAGHRIAEIGCKHAPHPWILSACNSLLAGFTDSALKHILATSMDNGIACESVHEDSGECVTGAAFATCAGFLAFSLLKACPGTRKAEAVE